MPRTTQNSPTNVLIHAPGRIQASGVRAWTRVATPGQNQKSPPLRTIRTETGSFAVTIAGAFESPSPAGPILRLLRNLLGRSRAVRKVISILRPIKKRGQMKGLNRIMKSISPHRWRSPQGFKRLILS